MKEVKSILEIDDGSIMKQVQAERKKVLNNIADVNTNTKPREISIKLTLKPDDKRKHIEMEAKVTSKIQPCHAIKTSMQLAIEDNSISAMELTPYADNQVDLFGEVHQTKVVKFENKKEQVM